VRACVRACVCACAERGARGGGQKKKAEASYRKPARFILSFPSHPSHPSLSQCYLAEDSPLLASSGITYIFNDFGYTTNCEGCVWPRPQVAFARSRTGAITPFSNAAHVTERLFLLLFLLLLLLLILILLILLRPLLRPPLLLAFPLLCSPPLLFFSSPFFAPRLSSRLLNYYVIKNLKSGLLSNARVRPAYTTVKRVSSFKEE
jgi:hypothetical protein